MFTSHDSTADRFAALLDSAHREMAQIEFLTEPWMPRGLEHKGKPVSNVVIVGAGMSGLTIAFGLKRRGVDGVRVLDRAPRGAEGPWVTSARMKTLRSPKGRTGPDLGIPSLTPKAWYVARYGLDAWEACERISRVDWMEYLNWFRDTVGITVESETTATDIGPVSGTKDRLLRVTTRTRIGVEEIFARRVLIATGLYGTGGPIVPAAVRELPKAFWTHSADICDDSHLNGKTVAVIGSATSAFDWATCALENDAASVTLLSRGADLARHEILLFTHFPGYLGHYSSLSPNERWRLTRLSQRFKVPPTQDQYDRAVADPRFRMVFGAGLDCCELVGGRVHIGTAKGSLIVDHLLLGTGYAEADMSMRPELATLAGASSVWSDCYTPPPDQEDAVLARHPYLAPDFSFTPKGNNDWVRRVHLFTNSSVPSVGPVSNGITGLKFGAPMMIDALVGALFMEDISYHEARMDRYDAVRFDPHFDTLGVTKMEVL